MCKPGCYSVSVLVFSHPDPFEDLLCVGCILCPFSEICHTDAKWSTDCADGRCLRIFQAGPEGQTLFIMCSEFMAFPRSWVRNAGAHPAAAAPGIEVCTFLGDSSLAVVTQDMSRVWTVVLASILCLLTTLASATQLSAIPPSPMGSFAMVLPLQTPLSPCPRTSALHHLSLGDQLHCLPHPDLVFMAELISKHNKTANIVCLTSAPWSGV